MKLKYKKKRPLGCCEHRKGQWQGTKGAFSIEYSIALAKKHQCFALLTRFVNRYAHVQIGGAR
jgi:hypothetical protein